MNFIDLSCPAYFGPEAISAILPLKIGDGLSRMVVPFLQNEESASSQ
jgi:hypothetical protein